MIAVRRDAVRTQQRKRCVPHGGAVHSKHADGNPMPQDRITISGPKSDGTYIVEFKTAAGEALAISVPSGETAVLKHFQERMPNGLVVPDAAKPPDDG